jgi:hypothetical protein
VIVEWQESELPKIAGVEWKTRFPPKPDSRNRLREVTLIRTSVSAEGRENLRRRQARIHANSRLLSLRDGDDESGAAFSLAALIERLELELLGQCKAPNPSESFLAVLDTGIDPKALRERFKHHKLRGRPKFSKRLSNCPELPPPFVEDSLAFDHGTRCAFDACLATRHVTLIDLPINAAQADSRISDAIAAVRHLQTKTAARPLVVLNPWQTDETDDALDDIPPSNAQHVFNLELEDLAASQVDIIFSVPMLNVPSSPPRLLGPASHSKVLAVTAIDMQDVVFDRAAPGPGALLLNKPDVAQYHRFVGFGPDPSLDLGTSAAASLAAGVVAAVRGLLGTSITADRMRKAILDSAIDIGSPQSSGAGRIVLLSLLQELGLI